jgi:hypothetical protein
VRGTEHSRSPVTCIFRSISGSKIKLQMEEGEGRKIEEKQK